MSVEIAVDVSSYVVTIQFLLQIWSTFMNLYICYLYDSILGYQRLCSLQWIPCNSPYQVLLCDDYPFFPIFLSNIHTLSGLVQKMS